MKRSMIAGIMMWLLAAATSGVHGALNFKVLTSDPKSVKAKKEKSQPSCTTAAVQCAASVYIDGEILKAQDKEDYCLLKYYFPGVCQGTYLDIGAGNGVDDSTSWAFYNSDLDWAGVNVEVNPDSFEELVRNRRHDIANIQAAVCSDTDRTVHYAHDVTSLHTSGIWEYTSEQYRETYWPGMTLFNTIEIMCTPIQRILDQTLGKNKNHYFDFATIHIEGAELNSLLGIDWSRTKFGLIIIEKSRSEKVNLQMHALLRSKGYILMENDEDECGRDFYYKNVAFEQIYSRLRVPQYYSA